MERTGTPRRITHNGRPMAVLVPAAQHPIDYAAREERFRRMLAIAERLNPDGDGDALLEELEREKTERRVQDKR